MAFIYKHVMKLIVSMHSSAHLNLKRMWGSKVAIFRKKMTLDFFVQIGLQPPNLFSIRLATNNKSQAIDVSLHMEWTIASTENIEPGGRQTV